MKKKKKKDLGSLGYYLSSRLTIARVIIPGRGQNQRDTVIMKKICSETRVKLFLQKCHNIREENTH